VPEEVTEIADRKEASISTAKDDLTRYMPQRRSGPQRFFLLTIMAGEAWAPSLAGLAEQRGADDDVLVHLRETWAIEVGVLHGPRRRATSS